jgi:integrase
VRAPTTLQDLAKAWSDADRRRGPRYAEQLSAFLQSLGSPKSLQTYRFSVLELFEWFASTQGRVPLPEQITRAEAARYAEYLRSRRDGLTEFRLQHDPKRQVDYAIVRYVREHPGAKLPAIARAVPRLSKDALDVQLARLVSKRILRRTPSVAEIRAKVDPRAQLDHRVDPNVFTYYVQQLGPVRHQADRAGTVTLRLSVLSSFWTWLTRNGENTGSTEPLLKFNIWSEAVSLARRQARARRRATRGQRTPEPALFERLVATTVPSDGAQPTLADLRDRAILLFLVTTGVRAEEMGSLRRTDIAGSPPVLTVTGKGGKVRSFRVPEKAMHALAALHARLDDLARRRGRVHEVGPDSPLLPALKEWGRNRQHRSFTMERGLTRSAIRDMLHRRGAQAGVDAAQMPRLHPHGLRHLAATSAAQRGVPAHVIQEVLGHSSLATTGEYLDTFSPSSVSL